jgi:hypothetical protein
LLRENLPYGSSVQQIPPKDRLIPFEPFGPNAMIMRDALDGHLYLRMTPPANVKVTRWNCICHPELGYRRPHFTCLAFCRIKRVAQGKLPVTIPVTWYRMYIHQGRAHARLKDWLLRKFVFPIAELLAN